jgi:hypothetical protein
MKTPIQEAIEKIQSLREIDAVINPIGVVESILTNMLEKEKEYYNKTFNTKEK